MVMTVRQAVAVTPHNSTDLDDACHLLYVGVSGNISVQTIDGGTAVYIGVPVGYHWIACTRVNATGTTATNILACWVGDV